MDTQKFHRSTTQKMIAGVCGGLGETLNIDPTWVRLFFILLALGNGAGVLLYIILWIIMPEQGGEVASQATIQANINEIGEQARSVGNDLRSGVHNPNSRAVLIIGMGLVLFGVLLFLQNLNIPWLQWVNFDNLWPLIIVAAGIYLLVRRSKGE
jgi:phage shock protein PspC (stress-responsive transcriptional regulator)